MVKPRSIWTKNGSVRQKMRARLRAEGRACHLCGAPIDYDLPAGHPYSFELDHIIPIARGGEPYDYANAAPAHRICNRRKGARMPGDKAQLVIKRTELF
ncbi:HNH endonuclease [Collinsella sp. zg1085]|uniref:HNH endonuclease n=1 Tax=Collinsella sp. zg1085 TaxID=2844380 RepID=UPI00209B00D6|nr:HNH endonuclease signature motif containing protein [Collinsella sp. zg1085]